MNWCCIWMQNEALTILTNYCVVKPGVSVSLSNLCRILLAILEN